MTLLKLISGLFCVIATTAALAASAKPSLCEEPKFTNADEKAVEKSAQASFNSCGTMAQIESAITKTLRLRGYKLTQCQFAPIKDSVERQTSKRCSPGFQYAGSCKCEGCPEGQYLVAKGKCCDNDTYYDGSMCAGASGSSDTSDSGSFAASGTCGIYSHNLAACTFWHCGWSNGQCYDP